MTSAQSRTHRFVVLWRFEAREIAGAAEVRRGWIERVPDPRAQEAGAERPERVGFSDLGELPALIARMIDDVDAAPGAAGQTPDRRLSG